MKKILSVTMTILACFWISMLIIGFAQAEVMLPNFTNRIMLKPNECGSAVYGGNQLLWFCAYGQDDSMSEISTLKNQQSEKSNEHFSLLVERDNLKARVNELNATIMALQEKLDAISEAEDLAKASAASVYQKQSTKSPLDSSEIVVTSKSNDKDNDGIVDSVDLCLDTAKEHIVDATGCSPNEEIVLEEVSFSFNSTSLSPASLEVLSNLATKLKQLPALKFELSGHTDNRGNPDYNMHISEQRARAVREYLIAEGVSASQLSTRGYGSEKPIASNATVRGRSLNRRVSLLRK